MLYYVYKLMKNASSVASVECHVRVPSPVGCHH